MKVAVINFSGNVGKSTVAKYLVQSKMQDAPYIAVETINADEGEGDAVKGKQFGTLQEQLMLVDDAIIDVGASNVEDFMKGMRAYAGAHEDMDFYIVPTTKERKQIRDTIATIEALRELGVPAKKIRVVFNKLEADETVDVAFAPLLAYHADSKAFVLNKSAVIYETEAFQKLGEARLALPDVLADQTDWRAVLREAKEPGEKADAAARISLKRLVSTVTGNLDKAHAAVFAK